MFTLVLCTDDKSRWPLVPGECGGYAAENGAMYRAQACDGYCSDGWSRVCVHDFDGEFGVEGDFVVGIGEADGIAETGSGDIELSQRPTDGLAHVELIGRQIEQVLNAGVDARCCDDRTAVGVTDQYRRPVEGVQDANCRVDVRLQARHWQLDGDAGYPGRAQMTANGVPHPSAVPEPVNHDDADHGL